jgi:hypothetical protein
MQPIVLVLRAIDRDETLGGVHMLNSPSFSRMGCHKYVATTSRPRAKGESGSQKAVCRECRDAHATVWARCCSVTSRLVQTSLWSGAAELLTKATPGWANNK